MRNYFKVLFMIGLFISLIGCGVNTENSGIATPDNTNEAPGMEGYVVAKDNGRILVVDPIPQDFSATGGVSEFYNAISFSNAPEDIQIGDQVQVWFDIVAESYPGQSEAKKVKVIESEKPVQADLTKAEAIQQALAQISNNNTTNQDAFGIIVVKSASFDVTHDIWNVQIKKGEEEFSIDVKDTTKNNDVSNSQVKTEPIPEVPVSELEKEFQAAIYQEVDETTRQVKHFHSKNEWVLYATNFMDKNLAESYADEFFNEKDGMLYLISRGGPILLMLEQPFELEQVNDNKVQVIQSNETDMSGKYELMITYEYRDDHWVMLDRKIN